MSFTCNFSIKVHIKESMTPMEPIKDSTTLIVLN